MKRGKTKPAPKLNTAEKLRRRHAKRRSGASALRRKEARLDRQPKPETHIDVMHEDVYGK